LADEWSDLVFITFGGHRADYFFCLMENNFMCDSYQGQEIAILTRQLCGCMNSMYSFMDHYNTRWCTCD